MTPPHLSIQISTLAFRDPQAQGYLICYIHYSYSIARLWLKGGGWHELERFQGQIQPPLLLICSEVQLQISAIFITLN